MPARLPPAPVLIAALASALALGACGSSSPAKVRGVSVAGPGAQTTKPPWKPEYAQLKARIAPLHLPKPGSEKFHVHELLHIYNDGILVPIAADIGIDESQGIQSALHTHNAEGIVHKRPVAGFVASDGVIHMEADKPFSATLGGFFQLWGVSFGPDHIGGLKTTKDKPLKVYVNGKLISDPASHRLAKDDNIVVAFGSTAGVPLVPDTGQLEAANGKGGRPAPCTVGKDGKAQTKCFATP